MVDTRYILEDWASIVKPWAPHVIITLVCVDPSYDCKFIWQLVNTTVNVTHIVCGWLQNGAEQPIENQEASVL